MPELPEIETLKNQITPAVLDKQIINFYTSGKRLRRIFPDFKSLINEKIINTYRRNKYLILETNNKWLIFHLGMTGQLTKKEHYKLEKHTHFVLFLSDGCYITYEDSRRFGSIDIYDKLIYSDYNKIPILSSLGIEPLSYFFTLSILHGQLEKTSLEIKKYLMNSQNICGIGNIYANEILFLSGIHPLKKTNLIKPFQIKKLHSTIINVLNLAISLGGSSISDFIHINGGKGSMQDNYYVYNRANQNCKNCNSLILRIKQGGRSTFYCNKCQK